MSIDHDYLISGMKRIEEVDFQYLVTAQFFTREDFWKYQESYFIKKKIFGKYLVHTGEMTLSDFSSFITISINRLHSA